MFARLVTPLHPTGRASRPLGLAKSMLPAGVALGRNSAAITFWMLHMKGGRTAENIGSSDLPRLPVQISGAVACRLRSLFERLAWVARTV